MRSSRRTTKYSFLEEAPPPTATPRPDTARVLASSGPPPLPAATDLTDAVFRGLNVASGRMQRERAANLLLAPGMPPSSRPRKMPRPDSQYHYALRSSVYQICEGSFLAVSMFSANVSFLKEHVRPSCTRIIPQIEIEPEEN